MKLKTSFEFDAAHRLVGYKGKCSRLHGHMWHVDLEIEGEGLDCNGILWDFTNAKYLKDLFDHKTILKIDEENNDIIKAIEEISGDEGLYIMKENPTAENLCKEILAHCKTSNPNLKYKVTVYESPKSYVEIEE
jgi:6-pyruvoyltetrahydropterin/6-carboxytetrahydropterin synthase